jgi:hypothetical protein
VSFNTIQYLTHPSACLLIQSSISHTVQSSTQLSRRHTAREAHSQRGTEPEEAHSQERHTAREAHSQKRHTARRGTQPERHTAREAHSQRGTLPGEAHSQERHTAREAHSQGGTQPEEFNPCHVAFLVTSYSNSCYLLLDFL